MSSTISYTPLHKPQNRSRFFLSLFVILLSTFLVYKVTDPMRLFDKLRGTPRNVPSSVKEKGVGSLVNDFAFKLLGTIVASGEKNVVIAPGTVWEVLRVLRSGATLNGDALKELRAILGVGENVRLKSGVTEDKGVTVRKASGVFVRGAIRDSWKKKVVELGAVAETLKNAEQVNSWVADTTDGMIKEIVKNVDENTLCIAANAVYFKGIWETVFDEKKTMDGKFKTAAGEMKDVKFMNRNDDSMWYGEFKLDDGKQTVRAVELPYGENEKYSSVFMLSEGTSAVELAKLLQKEGADVWDRWMSNMMSREVQLFLPRFKLEYGIRSLVQDLENLGVKAPFNSRGDSMFLRMTERKDVYIGDITHKTIVEVNEQGTRAAGVAAATLMMRSLPPPPVTMKFDKPFLFAIRSRQSGELLFMGTVDEP